MTNLEPAPRESWVFDGDQFLPPPPPSAEEVLAQVTTSRSALMAATTTIIARLQDADELGTATEDERNVWNSGGVTESISCGWMSNLGFHCDWNGLRYDVSGPEG